jgi:hypothetical protein
MMIWQFPSIVFAIMTFRCDIFLKNIRNLKNMSLSCFQLFEISWEAWNSILDTSFQCETRLINVYMILYEEMTRTIQRAIMRKQRVVSFPIFKQLQIQVSKRAAKNAICSRRSKTFSSQDTSNCVWLFSITTIWGKLPLKLHWL